MVVAKFAHKCSLVTTQIQLVIALQSKHFWKMSSCQVFVFFTCIKVFGRFMMALIAVLNSLPNDKILDPSKLKITVNEKLKFDMGRVENIEGKGENASYQYFLLFSQCFPRPFSEGQ